MSDWRKLPERKDCSRCGARRYRYRFRIDPTTPSGLSANCKECETSDKAPHPRSPYFRRYRAEKRIKIDAIKAALGCAKCGEGDPDVLQFHHLDRRTKDQTIARLYSGTWGWDRVLEEIRKCQVLCANCHIKLHREEDDARRKG